MKSLRNINLTHFTERFERHFAKSTRNKNLTHSALPLDLRDCQRKHAIEKCFTRKKVLQIYKLQSFQWRRRAAAAYRIQFNRNVVVSYANTIFHRILRNEFRGPHVMASQTSCTGLRVSDPLTGQTIRRVDTNRRL